MKRNFVRTFLVLLIVSMLVYLPSGVAEEAADSSVWDMSLQDVIALEGVTQADLFVLESLPFTQYGVVRLDRAYIYVAVYIFRAEQLVMYGETVGSSMQGGKALAYEDIYAYFLASLTEEYGEPTIQGPQRAIDAANAVQADSLLAGDIQSSACWETAAGTMLYHVYEVTDTEETIYTMYVSEEQLYQE